MKKYKFKYSAISFLLAVMFFAGCAASNPAPTEAPIEVPVATPTVVTDTPLPTFPPGSDFYRVSGTDIVDGSGNPVELKGIAMGNMIWSNNGIPDNDNNEESFRELSELGFNCVRYYLHYNFFEDDNSPYIYKESGFEWLNQAIEWAKKYNMRLILNMHAPQGGYQSQGNGDALWTEEENQKRLIALWTEIARRYAEEETIIGYGLINEPFVPVETDIKEATTKCQTLMQRIADGIRTVNHTQILFVERVCGVENIYTGENMWDFAVQDALYTINDSNTVYEFHYYDPYNFTHQNMDWSGTLGNITYYPSEEPIFSDVVSYWTGTVAASQKDTLEDGWTYFESGFAKRASNANVGGIALRAQNLGIGGTAFFDDIVVEEYKDGTFVRVVTTLDFEKTGDDFSYWSQDNSGRYYFAAGKGYNGSRCVALTGTTSDANVTGYRFELLEGYEYKISGKVKCVDTLTSSTVSPRIDYSNFKTISYRDMNYLDAGLQPYAEFREKYQVPIYLGEFGVCLPAWVENAGADQWVTDMLTLCRKYGFHFNYHSYHDYHFGLYNLPIDDQKRERNEALAEIFRELLK